MDIFKNVSASSIYQHSEGVSNIYYLGLFYSLNVFHTLLYYPGILTFRNNLDLDEKMTLPDVLRIN